jgi:chloramphenicol 3-O phosphotransferase
MEGAATQVIVLNGRSSSGKTGIARCLQAILPQPWLRLGVDDFVDALPPSLLDSGSGIAFGRLGEVAVGDSFRDMEAAWRTGIAAMARAGARVIIDDVFLGGAASQERTRACLAGLQVLWVGVRCDPEIAAGREIAPGRPGGRNGGFASGYGAPRRRIRHRGRHRPHRVPAVRRRHRGAGSLRRSRVTLPEDRARAVPARGLVTVTTSLRQRSRLVRVVVTTMSLTDRRKRVRW